MSPQHLTIAFIIVAAAHALLLYALLNARDVQETPVTPPVIQGTLITLPEAEPEPVPEPPKPPKKLPDPEPEKLPEPKPIPKPEPVPVPDKVVAVENTAVESSNAVAAEPTPPPPPEPVVIPPRADAKSRNNPPPAYPRIARRLGQEGTVVLEVFILANGSVGQVHLKKSSGHERLDEAAMEGVKHWRYIPAMRGDQPIDYWYIQPVKFVLN